ncbi:MAG: hypothetical protein KGR23_02220 [Betaproteobacteria bacterium]|nr:hypothetical protein [Betaproteobacteria bacterium]
MIRDWWQDWLAWWETVSPEFAFLLALPFAIAVASAIGECCRRKHHP